nr:leukosialin isoform X2 [Loxodonta africana]
MMGLSSSSSRMLRWVEPEATSFPLWALSAPVLPQPQEELEWPGPSPVPLAPTLRSYQLNWSQTLLMPVAMEVALLLLLFGGSWAPEVSTVSWRTMTTSQMPTSLDVSSISETLTLTSTASNSKKIDSTDDQPLSSNSSIANEKVTSLGTSVGVSTVPPAPEPTTSQEVSAKNSSMLPETSNATSDSAVSRAVSSLGFYTESRGTISGSLETFNRTSGPFFTMTTSSLETSSVTSGPPVTKATSSLETSGVTSGPPVTKAASSLETSSVTSGPPVTKAASSLETSSVTSGPPVTKTASSLETSTINISTTVTSETSKNTTTNFLSQGMNGNMWVAVLVALLVVIVLVVLLLLWRQRQKQRTGTLTLSNGGKRNKMVDTWAGPAQVPDEEVAITTVGGSGGDKSSGAPAGEGSGRRPTLTTFFGRRKSRQGSLALEEIEAGSAPSSKVEEEPLVGSEARALEAPTSDGPEVRDGNASQCL